MSKFDAQVKRIVKVLGLKWTPIAARFTSNADEIGDSSRKLAVCDAFDLVRHENVVLKLSKDNCSCPGGRHSAGFELLSLESMATTLTDPRHRIYRSKDIASASVRKQPKPVNRGDYLILGPLDRFTVDPDLVLFFVNPAQADRILGLACFDGAEPFMYYPASSICSTLTNALAKGKPEMNLVSHFERRRRGAGWTSDELLLALPLKDFEAAVKNISESGFGTVARA